MGFENTCTALASNQSKPMKCSYAHTNRTTDFSQECFAVFFTIYVRITFAATIAKLENGYRIREVTEELVE